MYKKVTRINKTSNKKPIQPIRLENQQAKASTEKLIHILESELGKNESINLIKNYGQN